MITPERRSAIFGVGATSTDFTVTSVVATTEPRQNQRLSNTSERKNTAT